MDKQQELVSCIEELFWLIVENEEFDEVRERSLASLLDVVEILGLSPVWKEETENE